RYPSLPTPAKDENFKGRLQQVAQERFGEPPFSDSVGAKGGAPREYTSVVFAGAEPLGTGHGASKQEAEQDAARAALQSLLGSAAGTAGQAKPPRAPRPRARRAPRSAPGADAEASPAGAEVIPLPEPAPEPQAVPSEPRSRQFGESLE